LTWGSKSGKLEFRSKDWEVKNLEERMLPEDIERILISSLKTPEHLNILRQKYKLSPRHFPYHPEPAVFIWDFIVQWGKAPDLTHINARFPKFEYAPTDDFDHIAEEFRKDFVKRSIYMSMETHAKSIEADAEAGIVGLISQLQGLQRNDESHQVIVDKDPIKRLEEYKLRADGIADQRMWWGIEPFDNFPVMMTRGQFIGIIANTKVGKSWLGLKIALANYMRGAKISIISPELNKLFLNARIDTILAYEMGFPISNEKLIYGVPGIEDNYAKFLSTKEMERGELRYRLHNPSDRFTVSSVATVVKSEKPDLVLVDGIYLMQDEEHGSQSWEQIRNKCRGLKTLATESNITLLVTNQSGRERGADENSSTPAAASNVAYGYDFNRFVDILVSIGGAANNPNVREVAIPLIRSGRAVTGSYPITFDTDTGDIGRTVGEIAPMSMANINF